jgi:type II secretory pathway pseudopilin PulG
MIQQLPARGFTLVETLVATVVLITAIAGLAQLFVLTARFMRDSTRSRVALVAAQDKLEMLNAMRFGYDDDGAPVGDARLAPSPPGSLDQNVDEFFEWLTGDGTIASGRGASYVRRWRITAVDLNEPPALAIDVCVYATSVFDRGPDHADACLGSVRVRQP